MQGTWVGFRVPGSGSVQDSAYRVHVSGLRGQGSGLGFRDQGSGFKGTGFKGTGSKVQGSRFRTQDSGFDASCEDPNYKEKKKRCIQHMIQ